MSNRAVILWLGLAMSSWASLPPASTRAFLKSYCHDCHGEQTQKAERRFDTLRFDLSDRDNLRRWQEILDVLHRGEMPPRKKNVAQPDAPEIRVVVSWLETELPKAYAKLKSTGGQTIYRRLNRFEYRNTIRDLLGINTEFIDPTELFLPDEEEEGLDNIGNALVTSDYTLQQAMAAAEKMIQRATRFGERPKTGRWSFAGPVMKKKGGILTEASRQLNPYDEIFEQAGPAGRTGYVAISDLPEGVPTTGRYRVRVSASSNNQRHPWGEMIPTDQDRASRLGVVIFNAREVQGPRYHASDKRVGEFALPESGERRMVELEVLLEEGWAPRFSWANGPFRAYSSGEKLLKRYYPKLYRERPDRRLGTKAKNEHLREMGRLLIQNNLGPTIRVHRVEIEGPLIDQWPPMGHQLMYGNGEVRSEDIERHLHRFANQAFRRPVPRSEIAAYVDLVRRYEGKGKTATEALQIGIKALLASTSFLHLPELNEKLSDYELASRLSYFLWSSMPDASLFDQAKRGELRKPKTLRAQVERMLKNPKSTAFVEHFTDRWLRLDKIGSMPPDSKTHRLYYTENLDAAMKRETHLFFGHILKHNLDIATFLDSDFTFVNRGLAELYGMPPLEDAELVKVAITNPRRRGLLGHASILTATANGIDTSPIIRGVWLLESLLGTPPPAPPPDVEPLSPDLRGAKSIREQLAKHREITACNDCHRRIDPMGFALENFGPIGEWRDTYPESKSTIDASAQLPTGERYRDINEFRALLLKRKHLVLQQLARRLLEYSTGRILEAADRVDLDHVIETAKKNGGGLRDLIHAVAQSESFRTK
ncbi:MAG: hypothetical protein CMO80_23845 [Verrucomicrobiales bacterium]|nr:hypothetical protein [Verrucomicrobiales bacterium]